MKVKPGHEAIYRRLAEGLDALSVDGSGRSAHRARSLTLEELLEMPRRERTAG